MTYEALRVLIPSIILLAGCASGPSDGDATGETTEAQVWVNNTTPQCRRIHRVGSFVLQENELGSWWDVNNDYRTNGHVFPVIRLKKGERAKLHIEPIAPAPKSDDRSKHVALELRVPGDCEDGWCDAADAQRGTNKPLGFGSMDSSIALESRIARTDRYRYVFSGTHPGIKFKYELCVDLPDPGHW